MPIGLALVDEGPRAVRDRATAVAIATTTNFVDCRIG